MAPRAFNDPVCICIRPGCRDFVDSDGDGLGDACDSCPNHVGTDTDHDGVCAPDNCPYWSNPDQRDGDGIGDSCDPCVGDPTPDTDHDGICSGDNCPNVSNRYQSDLDGDGLGNSCDDDIDADGVPNSANNCVYDPNSDQKDTDTDGIGDACDCTVGNFSQALPTPDFVCDPMAGTYKWNLFERRLANVIRYFESHGIEGPWSPLNGCALVPCSTASDRGYNDAAAFVDAAGNVSFGFADIVAILTKDTSIDGVEAAKYINFRRELNAEYGSHTQY